MKSLAGRRVPKSLFFDASIGCNKDNTVVCWIFGYIFLHSSRLLWLVLSSWSWLCILTFSEAEFCHIETRLQQRRCMFCGIQKWWGWILDIYRNTTDVSKGNFHSGIVSKKVSNLGLSWGSTPIAPIQFCHWIRCILSHEAVAPHYESAKTGYSSWCFFKYGSLISFLLLFFKFCGFFHVRMLHNQKSCDF